MKYERRNHSATRERNSDSLKRSLIKTPSSKRFPKDFFNQTTLFSSHIQQLKTPTPLILNLVNKHQPEDIYREFTFRGDNGMSMGDRIGMEKENEQMQGRFNKQPVMKKTSSLNQRLLSKDTGALKRISKIGHRNFIQK